MVLHNASANSFLGLKHPPAMLKAGCKCIFTCMYLLQEQIGDTDELLHLVELLPSQNVWMIIMMGGGHFAAAVFQK